jgi:hypothetical protein
MTPEMIAGGSGAAMMGGACEGSVTLARGSIADDRCVALFHVQVIPEDRPRLLVGRVHRQQRG